jgi:hypothetical protein
MSTNENEISNSKVRPHFALVMMLFSSLSFPPNVLPCFFVRQFQPLVMLCQPIGWHDSLPLVCALTKEDVKG